MPRTLPLRRARAESVCREGVANIRESAWNWYPVRALEARDMTPIAVSCLAEVFGGFRA